MPKIILGFDASTTTIGICCLKEEDNGSIKLIKIEHYKPPKDIHILDILKQTKEYIMLKLKEFSPDEVIIEEYIKFMLGKSSSDSTISLAVLNRTICMTIYEYFNNKKPYIINVNTIRAIIKPKNYSLKRIPKEDVPNVMAKHLNINWNWLKGKKGKILPESFDEADSCAAAYALILGLRSGKIKLEENYPNKKSKKTKKKLKKY